jgi:hypothetical protein
VYSVRGLSGVLVNTGTLVHEAGTTNFNGASLQNSGTAEVRGGTWNNNTGTNSLVNTGTLNKTTTSSFTIPVPMQQQGATVNVQAGTLTLSAGSNTHQDVGMECCQWSVVEVAVRHAHLCRNPQRSHRRHAGSDGWHGAGGQ